MFQIISEVDRPESDIVDKFSDIPTTIISDVSNKSTFVMDSGINPVYDNASMVGTAITAKVPPKDNLMIHKMVTLAESGDVLVIDAEGYTEAGPWGELLSASAQSNGIAGTVIDGAVRDVPDIKEMDYPVYARGTSPRGTFKKSPGSINVPVSCGDIIVDSGDIIIGDEEGVAVVPSNSAQEILEKAESKIERESHIRQQIEQGEYIYDIADFDGKMSDLDIEGQT